MRCPACADEEMLVLEFERVEIDYCGECGGVWLDAGELELIGRRAGAVGQRLTEALSARDVQRPSQGRRRCPVCGKRLGEVRTGGDPSITVDRCGRADGLWFDRGELSAVVRQAGGDRDNLLARFFEKLDDRRADAPQASARED